MGINFISAEHALHVLHDIIIVWSIYKASGNNLTRPPLWMQNVDTQRKYCDQGVF